MSNDLSSIPGNFIAEAMNRLAPAGPDSKPTSALVDAGDRWGGRYLVAFVARRAGSHNRSWYWTAVSAQRLDAHGG